MLGVVVLSLKMVKFKSTTLNTSQHVATTATKWPKLKQGTLKEKVTTNSKGIHS